MFTRSLNNRQIIQRLIKSGIKFTSENSAKIVQTGFKNRDFMVVSQNPPASDTKEFTSCMRFIRKESAAFDALIREHKNSSNL